MVNKKMIFEGATFIGMLAGAIVACEALAPALKKVFGIKEKEKEQLIPSTDITEKEISEDE